MIRWIKYIFCSACLRDIREEIKLGYNDRTNILVERYFRYKVYLLQKQLK